MSGTNCNKYKIKWLLPQIYASCLSTSYYLTNSASLAFPTFLIPALESNDSDIKVTVSQSSWTATISILALTVFSLINGPLVHKFGAINVMRMASVPGVIGWVMVAMARNISVLLIGRFSIGVACALAASGPMYATEVTRPDIRGSILNTISGFVSAGLVLSNFTGYFVHWRTLAWINNIYFILPTVLISFVPESPIWLIFKGRFNKAKEAIRRFNKFHPNLEDETEMQYEELLKDYKEKTTKKAEQSTKDIVKSFAKPTGYKPLLLATGVFFFQQSSGIYIILVHTIILFRNIGSDIDINIIPAILSMVRLVTSIGLILTMKYFNKRNLMLTSLLGMAVSILCSGFFTLWIKEGTTTYKWVPLALIILYVFFALCGVVPIPWTLTSEIFPTNIRGYGQGFTTAIAHGCISLAIQNYRYLEHVLGGTHAIQFFFSAMGFLGMVFVYFFLPETHNKKLIEIEEYFEKHWIYRRRKSAITVISDAETDDGLKKLKSGD